MRRRSNLLVLLGLASFVLGLLAVYLITSDDDEEGGGDGESVEVLVAAENLEAGTRGDDVLSGGLYRVERVDNSERQTDALSVPSQLSGQVLTLAFAEGEQIRTAGLRNIGGGARAQIPEGFEAVAVTVDFVAGGASTIVPGDRVNAFFVVPDTVQAVRDTPDEPLGDPPFPHPRTELLLTNVLVLDVQTGTPPLQVSQPADPALATGAGGNSLIVVLAVDTIDAEKVIFTGTTTGTSLYLSRVRLDDEQNPSPPVQSTPGQDFDTILTEEAGAAFSRSNP